MKNNKLIGAAISLIAVSFAITMSISFFSMREVIKSSSQELGFTLIEFIYDEIAKELIRPISVSRTMANDYYLISEMERESSSNPEVAEKSESEIRKYLTNIRNTFEYDSAFVVSDGTKKYYTFRGVNKVVDPEVDSHDIWYPIFLSKNAAYDFDVDVDQMNRNNWTVFINARIEKDGKLLGACGVGLQMIRLQKFLSEYEKSHGIKIDLVDRNGLVQVDTEEIRIENAVLDTEELSFNEGREYKYIPGTKTGSYTVIKYISELGWYLVVSSNEGSSAELSHLLAQNLVSLGFILLVLLAAIKIFLYRDKHHKLVIDTDKMTGLLSRYAYENVMNKLRASSSDVLKGISIVVLDVNGLKTANDSIGHFAGDELIKAAAENAKSFFGKYGKVYRTGGDEFVVIADKDLGDIDSVKKKFHELNSQCRGNYFSEVSVSVGIAKFGVDDAANIGELSEIADKDMYKDKEAYYAQTGKDRRKR